MSLIISTAGARGQSFKPLTLQEATRALQCIPADLPRDDWVMIAATLHNEFGDAAFTEFDQWSKSGATYRPQAAHDTWKSCRTLTRYGMGSLIALAKKHGYRDPTRYPLTPTERARLDYDASEREHARKQRDAQIKTQRDETQARVARRAQEIWEQQSVIEQGTHPYLQRKGVAAHGTRRTISDEPALIVPMRDAAGMLCNLQFIAPNGEKRFMTGGRVTGCYYALSEPMDAARIIICEGFATGASLAANFSGAVIVAFNAGNLRPVAEALRIVFPTMPMVIAADWDTPTDGDGGTGYKAACAVAIAVDAEVWSPVPIPGRNKTDFNDSHLWQQQQRRAA